MKTALLAVAAILAFTPTALASGGGVHLDLDETGEAHTIDVLVDDEGNAAVLIDGEAPQATPPSETPTLPEAPAVPDAPALPDEDDIPGGI